MRRTEDGIHFNRVLKDTATVRGRNATENGPCAKSNRRVNGDTIG